jgi:hypothetical protein
MIPTRGFPVSLAENVLGDADNPNVVSRRDDVTTSRPALMSCLACQLIISGAT